MCFILWNIGYLAEVNNVIFNTLINYQRLYLKCVIIWVTDIYLNQILVLQEWISLEIKDNRKLCDIDIARKLEYNVWCYM
jgi:hypothetical protein